MFVNRFSTLAKLAIATLLVTIGFGSFLYMTDKSTSANSPIVLGISDKRQDSESVASNSKLAALNEQESYSIASDLPTTTSATPRQYFDIDTVNSSRKKAGDSFLIDYDPNSVRIVNDALGCVKDDYMLRWSKGTAQWECTAPTKAIFGRIDDKTITVRSNGTMQCTTNNHLLYWDSTKQHGAGEWRCGTVGDGVIVPLTALSDVNATSPVNGEVLLYNGTQWVDTSISTALGGLGALSAGVGGLVNTTTAQLTCANNEDILSFNNTTEKFDCVSVSALAVTEIDTLQSVTDRGATTTNSITAAGLTTAGAISASSITTSTLSATGNSTIGGTFGVTGNTSLSTLSTSGLATFSSGINLNSETFTDLTGTGLLNNSGALTVSLTPFSTTDLSEGSNLYFTNERTDDQVATSLIQNGTGINWTYNDALGTFTPAITLGTSIDISEETNLTAGTSLTLTNDTLNIDDDFLRNTGDSASGDYNFSSGTLFVDDSTGRVGIGTTTPGAKLEIDGRIRFTTALDTDDAPEIFREEIGSQTILRIRSGNNGNDRIDISTFGWNPPNHGPVVLQSGSSGRVGVSDISPDSIFEVSVSGNSSDIFMLSSNDDNDGDLMIVKNSGNVGINTTSPSQKFHVAGNARITGALYDSANSAGTNGQILTTTGTGTDWADPATALTNTLGIDDLTDATKDTTNNNIFLGHDGGNAGATDNYNTALGLNALDALNNSGGDYNTAVGYDALSSNTSGDENTAIGHNSLISNISGYRNVATGLDTLYSNTTGYSNSAYGRKTLYYNTTGEANSAYGERALYYNTTGGGNSAFGAFALYENATGSQNVAQGHGALGKNITGSNNIAIGYMAGYFISGGTSSLYWNKTNNHNIFLGDNTKALADNDQNEIVIGYNATGIGSNSVTLGNDSITTTALKGNVGIGTTSPGAKLDVLATSGAQGRFSYDATNFAELVVGATGDLEIATEGGDVALNDENVRVCSGGACPADSATLAGQGNIVAEGKVFAEGFEPATCPTGMIPVPASPQNGIQGFCIDKYEAKNVSGIATSQAASTPWTSITQYDAREQCVRAGKHLVTEAQWLAVAHNVEDTGSNWNGGVAGTNQMSDGHSDNSPAGKLAADITGDADDDPCVGTGQACDQATWNTQRRTYQLSNNEYIWDIGGNVWEWTDQTTRDSYPLANNWGGWVACSTSGDGRCGNTITTNDQRYGGNTTVTRGFLRGGDWNDGTRSGAFALDLSGAPTYTGGSVGFRCAL